jgi:hypothetical protein
VAASGDETKRGGEAREKRRQQWRNVEEGGQVKVQQRRTHNREKKRKKRRKSRESFLVPVGGLNEQRSGKYAKEVKETHLIFHLPTEAGLTHPPPLPCTLDDPLQREELGVILLLPIEEHLSL